MKYFTAYIDEAGDEGFGKLRQEALSSGQSTWLIIGAIVVGSENDKLLPGWKRDLRDKFPEKKSKDLHWKSLNHDQRIVVSDFISNIPIGISMTLSHKVTIPGSKHEEVFKQKQYLYNYLVRWLLERLILACERAAAPDTASLKLVFSKRGGTNYSVMSEYLQNIADGLDVVKAPRKTNWSVLDIEGIEVQNHSKRAGLQIADCTTSAFFTALEPNRYGNIEPVYAYSMLPRLIRLNRTVQNSGFTIVPNVSATRCSVKQLDVIKNICSGQAPGS